MRRFTIEEIVRATAAHRVHHNATLAPMRVVTDTRSLEHGDAFLALRGERFDGHEFVADAFAKGAALAIVDRAVASMADRPVVEVTDTLLAYMALASAARARFDGHVIAITGSSGKTTTKHLLSQLLRARYGNRLHVTSANENNEIGVSKLLLESHDDHDVIVVEMGARKYRDIHALVEIAQPHFGLLTNVGEAHLEIVGSRERLAETKWGLFSTGAAPLLNARDRVSQQRAATLGQLPHWYDAMDEDRDDIVRAPFTALIRDEIVVHRELNGRPRRARTELFLPGHHNRVNAAGAAAAAIELGFRLDELAELMPTLTLPEGRYQRHEIPDFITIVYDAYNANASSMRAAIDAFGNENGARHIAVLASMAELGDESERLHELVGEHLQPAKIDEVLVGGEYAEALERGALRAGFPRDRVWHFTDNHAAALWLLERTKSGDVVLLKGSRRYHMEEILDEVLTACGI